MTRHQPGVVCWGVVAAENMQTHEQVENEATDNFCRRRWLEEAHFIKQQKDFSKMLLSVNRASQSKTFAQLLLKYISNWHRNLRPVTVGASCCCNATTFLPFDWTRDRLIKIFTVWTDFIFREFYVYEFSVIVIVSCNWHLVNAH